MRSVGPLFLLVVATGSAALAQVRAGSEFRANSYTTGQQYLDSVAVGPDGGVTVAWDSNGQGGSAAGMFAHRYDAGGAPRSGEFQVNTYTTGVQFGFAANVAFDARGQFVLSFASVQDGSGPG